MAPQKRKSNYVSDDFVVSDEESQSAPPTKRSKGSSSDAKVDDDGNEYWEISKARRATVSDFKGKKMVSIREYYEKDGKSLPGKKGISMTLEQYNAFVAIMPQIEQVLTQGGVAEVFRPDYDRPVSNKRSDTANEDDESAAAKANHEATSDEDD